MIAHVTKSAIGWFAFDDKGELIFYQLISPDPVEALGVLTRPIPKSFLRSIKGYESKEDDFARELISERLREYALSLGFVEKSHELNEFLVKLGMMITKEKSKRYITKDKLIVCASSTLNDLNKQINTFFEHLQEWYGLHYPELKLPNEKYTKMVAQYGLREHMPGFKSSSGIALNEKDIKIIKQYTSLILDALKLKKGLEEYITDTVKEVCPNMSSLIDPLLAARILTLAGSLKKLARMSSSTIQLLGAEKALFRHLKNKKRVKPPKYGLIFFDKRVQNAPKHDAGKIARTIASKIMMAAKIDYYSGRFEPKLKEDLEKELEKIRKR